MPHQQKSGEVVVSVTWLAVSISLLVCIFLTLIYFAVPSVLREYAEGQRLQTLSQEYGFRPDWGGADDYLEESIRPGMTRQEVYLKLWRIAPFRIFPLKFSRCLDEHQNKAMAEEMYMSVTWNYDIHRVFCFDLSGRLLDVTRIDD